MFEGAADGLPLRAELLALKWSDVDLNAGVIDVRRNHLRVDPRSIEKNTKTHRMRRVALGPATVELLSELRARYEENVRKLGMDRTNDAYLFSYEPAYDRPYDPDGVTHKYSTMCAAIGIDSHLHALRHYFATELLTAGASTCALSLAASATAATRRRFASMPRGSESDRRAANILGSRMRRPAK